jgi:hypothetical protein
MYTIRMNARMAYRTALVAILVLMALMVAASYYKYVILHDYPILVQTSCDPYTESCFAEACEEGDEGCEHEGLVYVKYLEGSAAALNRCFSESPDASCEACSTAGFACVEIQCDQLGDDECHRFPDDDPEASQ